MDEYFHPQLLENITVVALSIYRSIELYYRCSYTANVPKWRPLWNSCISTESLLTPQPALDFWLKAHHIQKETQLAAR